MAENRIRSFPGAGDTGHGGNLRALARRAGVEPGAILDFSASINPLGPPASLRRIVSRSLEKIVHYPDPECSTLVVRLAGSLGIDREQVVAANGSTELIYALPGSLGCRRGVIPVPSYTDYERACRMAGLDVVRVGLSAERNFHPDLAGISEMLLDGDLVFLGHPNNPTGVTLPAADLLSLVAAHPRVFFAVDESFLDFVEQGQTLVARSMPANLVVVRSLTKFYAIPGLRAGFGACAPGVAAKLRECILPWSVNTLAQEVAAAVIDDRQYGAASRAFMTTRRAELQDMLAAVPGVAVFPGEANFLLARLDNGSMIAGQLADRLLVEGGIGIRDCGNFPGLDPRYFRVGVRGREENERLVEAITRVVHPISRGGGKKKPRHTPALMFQGTASNAGKSVLTAALCRIFLQDGIRVAPFKAQNMSLNSFVTRNGEEMGRAQVVQAQACRLDPDVRMNPVLLKPASEVGSQVIVMGRPVGTMGADNYLNYREKAARAARDAYDSLAAEHELVVLEGAGSPAEVNLKQHDIVNMSMARHARARVLLVGDIDRGGLFASFIGTLEVMEEWERRLVAGFVVNRFRGMESLLADAYRYTEEFTGKAVIGTVPFIRDLGLPEEDSVGFKAGLYEKPRPAGEHVVIGVVDLPHISNFTDVEPFLAEPDVHLRVLRTAEELRKAAPELDALILPGSKNVPADLVFLHETGFSEMIGAAVRSEGNITVVGICGGYQMLGTRVCDPHGIETGDREVPGMGLLALETTLAEEKTLVRREALHTPSGLRVHGYEIHHGRTGTPLSRVLRDEKGWEDGAVSEDGRVWGTYLHGIFDDDVFRRWFIDRLREKRALQPLDRVVAPYDLEPAFDRLAEVVRGSLDMDRIYALLGM
ncbi:MAG: cobyric acid synthase [Desulfobulbaceae bacterium]